MSVQVFITGTGCRQGTVPKPRIQMKVFYSTLAVSEILETRRILMGLSGWENIIEYKHPQNH